MSHDIAYLNQEFARFYDWSYEGPADDIPFYLGMAQRYGSPLLELGCGTGRLSIPLASAGFRITGLDISREMLAIAEGKLSREPPEVRERVCLVQGNMSDFDLQQSFCLAFIPVASFFHLHARERQVGCLTCVRKHLPPGGAIAVDLIPAEMMANQAVGVTRTVKSGVWPATGKLTRELNRKLAIDRERQCVTVEHTYTEKEFDGSEESYVFIQDYTWVTEDQMRGMLRDAGFTRIAVFGGYDLCPTSDNAHRMIFVAERP